MAEYPRSPAGTEPSALGSRVTSQGWLFGTCWLILTPTPVFYPNLALHRAIFHRILRHGTQPTVNCRK
jgi:hypothetical protein